MFSSMHMNNIVKSHGLGLETRVIATIATAVRPTEYAKRFSNFRINVFREIVIAKRRTYVKIRIPSKPN